MKESFNKFRKKILFEALIKSSLISFALAIMVYAVPKLIVYFGKINVGEFFDLILLLLVNCVFLLVFGVLFLIMFPRRLKVAKRLDKELELNQKVQTMVEYKDKEGFMINIQREDTLRILSNTHISKLTLNKRGLIYVERSIDLDLSQGFDSLNFSSIGECWSWKKSNSSSYCSKISLLNNNKSKVVICGYVHPDSIDWLETVYLNSYDMKNETEIRMNDNALVEVSYIIIDGVKQFIGGSYLINASVDKYNKNKGDW